MTITAENLDLVEVTRKAPSTSGYYRNVWFVGDDLVVKRDRFDNGEACQTEYNNYLEFSDFDFEIDNEVFHVRFPETTMVGPYLIMQRIKHEFLKDMYSRECPDKPAGAYSCSYDDHYENHRSGILERAIETEMDNRYDITDMHCENFMFDRETNTFWILDFAQ